MALVGLFLAFGVGLFVIVRGSSMVVDASVRLQNVTGLGEISIGAVFVSVATTLPEVFVSIFAVAAGDNDIAVGNAVGSMIFNMCACVAVYLFARQQIVPRGSVLGKTLYLLAMLSVIILFSLNGRLGLAEGVVLFAFFIIFIVSNFRGAGTVPFKIDREKCNRRCITQIVLLFVAGQLMLVAGAWLLVSFGERIAHSIHIAETTVAILFIAVGTGLPELFTAITSIRTKHNGIALGNILGACILNCTLLLGTSSMISGIKGLPIPNGILALALPVMIISTLVAMIPIIVTQKTRARYGVVLIAIYAAYIFLICY